MFDETSAARILSDLSSGPLARYGCKGDEGGPRTTRPDPNARRSMGLPRVMCCALHMGGRPRHALCEKGMTAACQLFNYLMGLLGPVSAQVGERRAMYHIPSSKSGEPCGSCQLCFVSCRWVSLQVGVLQGASNNLSVYVRPRSTKIYKANKKGTPASETFAKQPFHRCLAPPTRSFERP